MTRPERPAAGEPVIDYEAAYARLAGDGSRGGSRSRPEDLGFDDVYQAHDGLGPDELDIVWTPEGVEDDEPEWRDDWTLEDKRGVALIVALIVVAIVCYRLGELSALGWFS